MSLRLDRWAFSYIIHYHLQSCHCWPQNDSDQKPALKISGTTHTEVCDDGEPAHDFPGSKRNLMTLNSSEQVYLDQGLRFPLTPLPHHTKLLRDSPGLWTTGYVWIMDGALCVEDQPLAPSAILPLARTHLLPAPTGPAALLLRPFVLSPNSRLTWSSVVIENSQHWLQHSLLYPNEDRSSLVCLL